MLDSPNRQALVIAALALIILAITPREAHASREGDMLPALLAINVVFGSAALFGTIDVVYMARGEPLPVGWAIAQLAIPTPVFLGLAAFYEGGDDQNQQLRVHCGIFGAWFLGHAVVNLLLPRDETLDAAVVPTPDGAMVLGRIRL